MSSPEFTLAPAPWTCKCETYWLPFWSSSTLPADAYAPLEASSAAFSSPALAGSFHGGLGMMQIVRYSDTPVGPYDELLLLPGAFSVPGTSPEKKHNRVTRIYVSQKATTYNGRKNWNIPKHLARFAFSHPPTRQGSRPPDTLTVEVFPPGENTAPFFTATLRAFRWVPAVPYWQGLVEACGVDMFLVQPPLPAGKAKEECGTQEWRKTKAVFSSPRMRGMWVDLNARAVGGGEAQALLGGGEEGWWPEIRPWAMGLWLEDVTLEFGVPVEP
ncbi:MAG: hypothetical protein M1829_002486 [Trizodia sp. TS-e1964]|nr:MAG: hypothetical protein M1829_002486 [Trizodia sp. TS-e1964]